MTNYIEEEGRRILRMSPEEAKEYMAWRYRRTRELFMAHDMTDEEIEAEVEVQYKKLVEKYK